MNELFDLRPTNKEVAFGILFVFVLLVGFFCAGYMLGCERTEDLYNNGAGVKPITDELGKAESNINNAASGIHNAQEHAGKVQTGIDSATESANYIYGTAKTSAELIGQCQRIVETVRRRGETETIKN